MIKIFVGTCYKNIPAEIALESSIKKFTKSLCKITWMRDREPFIGWNTENWGTGFTPFRWVVPELCNFTGKAIYLDVDVILNSDIKELWDVDLEDKFVASLFGNYSVMVFNCEKFKELSTYASINEWKKNSCVPAYNGLYSKYVNELESKKLIKFLAPEWNCLDGLNCDWKTAKLIHFTQKDTQPWKPYPEKHKYKKHKIPELELLWLKNFKGG
jgi:lipopolysaccharide biosynthesis glycosyltransferase